MEIKNLHEEIKEISREMKLIKKDLKQIKEDQKIMNHKIERCEKNYQNSKKIQILFLKEMIKNFQNMLNKISDEENKNAD